MGDQVTEAKDVPGSSSTPAPPKSRKSALQRNYSARRYIAFNVDLEISIPEAVSLDEFFQQHSQDLETKIREAVEQKKHDVTDPKQNFKKVTSKIKEDIKEIGPWGEPIDVIIMNSKEMDQKVEEIRKGKNDKIIPVSHFLSKTELAMRLGIESKRLVERSRCLKEHGMTEMHKEIILHQKEKMAKDLEVKKMLNSLMSQGIFEMKDEAAIEEESGDRAKRRKLLDRLFDKIPDRFDDFVEILLSGTQSFHAISLLKEERKESQKERDALWSYLSAMAEARQKLYEEKYELNERLEDCKHKVLRERLKHSRKKWKRDTYSGKHYKQLHGTAMGSPVSVVIAEIVMQNIEERALSTCRQTIPLWLRYVDDTFTAVRHDEIDAFHNHLNEQNTDIQFTREVEENGKLPFLDCLVSHNDNSLRTTVYRKPTHTDRLLDESSYNPTSHKATTIRTLTRRAQLVCDSTDSLSDENKYLHRVFTKNNYNNDFIRRNTHRPTTTTETNDTATPTTTATIPYIKGMSENISRILLPFNIRVAHKPITTLRQLLTNVKDKDEPRNRQGTIYKINCSDCQASYIGETGRNLTTRLTEHRRATRKEQLKQSSGSVQDENISTGTEGCQPRSSDDCPQSSTSKGKLQHAETRIKDGRRGNEIVSKISTMIDKRYKGLQENITEKVNAVFQEEDHQWSKEMKEVFRDLENEIERIEDEAAKKSASTLEKESGEKNLLKTKLQELQREFDTNKDRFSELQKLHKKEENECQQLKDAVEAKDTKLTELTTKNGDIGGKLQALESEGKAKGDKILSLEEQIKKQNISLESVKEQLKQEQTKSRVEEKLRKTIDEQQKQIKQLKVNLKSTRKQLTESKTTRPKQKKTSQKQTPKNLASTH
ncbi:hypothetical protein AWC38_SpisGene11181 [Stylophora pistillata]|uniref:CARD domain-containing protein n=1 Tax=Stylophora pistillata TaxID=50429 RepID=A0A2B4S0J9_STYPI|nr:hypothetical protein AWC38_SpisGene11181 [Stylophora pistillata]